MNEQPPKFVPITFTAALVRRIIGHQKWETRRIVKPAPAVDAIPKPKIPVGAIAYVREAHFIPAGDIDTATKTIYQANFPPTNVPNHRWVPGRSMNAELTRVWLPINEARVEPLQMMTNYSFMREGFGFDHVGAFVGLKAAKESFTKTWDYLHRNDGDQFLWNGNPFVFVYAWGDIVREAPAGWDEYLAGVQERRRKRHEKEGRTK